MMKALDDFGRGMLADFIESDSVIQFGVPPVRMTSCTGVSFEQAWAGRIVATVEGLTINFIGHAELIRNKRMTVDVQQLEDSNPRNI